MPAVSKTSKDLWGWCIQKGEIKPTSPEVARLSYSYEEKRCERFCINKT